jgi:predicted nuclease of restriction endonuclease-like RecB superfamily
MGDADHRALAQIRQNMRVVSRESPVDLEQLREQLIERAGPRGVVVIARRSHLVLRRRAHVWNVVGPLGVCEHAPIVV